MEYQYELIDAVRLAEKIKDIESFISRVESKDKSIVKNLLTLSIRRKAWYNVFFKVRADNSKIYGVEIPYALKGEMIRTFKSYLQEKKKEFEALYPNVKL